MRASFVSTPNIDTNVKMSDEQRVGQHEDPEADHLTDRLQVVGEARHEVADALVLEVREVLRLKVREEIVAHLVLDAA